jgi:hypothetical protein
MWRSREGDVVHPETFTATITIGAPAETVVAVLADPSRHPAIDGTGAWIKLRL